jgi:redoxin
MRRGGLVALLVLIAALAGWLGPVAALEVGDKAPGFALPATTKEKLSLAEFTGKKNVVLFGFIGAFTPT